VLRIAEFVFWMVLGGLLIMFGLTGQMSGIAMDVVSVILGWSGFASGSSDSRDATSTSSPAYDGQVPDELFRRPRRLGAPVQRRGCSDSPMQVLVSRERLDTPRRTHGGGVRHLNDDVLALRGLPLAGHEGGQYGVAWQQLPASEMNTRTGQPGMGAKASPHHSYRRLRRLTSC